MAEWFLVIALIYYHRNAPAITTVPGFKTEAACQAAASATHKSFDFHGVETLCVKDR